MLVAALGLLAQVTVVAPAEASEHERVARDARSAQGRFERVRRANLPRKAGRGTTSLCDANIGRFCYWYDSTEIDPDPEPPRILQARLDLLVELDSFATHAMADPWIAGQRVRYNIEAGRLDAALAAAQSCEAEAWWCAALAGTVHHVSRDYVAADSAFADALRHMPRAQRCEWLDISLIGDGRWRRSLRESTCDRREALANMAFALGQPLWMVEGSDLRTEHFTRHTMALVYARSANAYGMSFGDDSRELLLRYGWPDWYTRHELGVGGFPSFGVTGHDREPTYYFFPDVPRIEGALPTEDAWRLRATPVPSRYAPRHIERMTRLPHQLGRFPRGDSLLLVATYRVVDTVLERDRSEAAIAILRDDSVRTIARAREGPLAAMTPNDSMIVSVEVHGDSSMHAARARYAISPLACDAWCLSDVLLVDPTRVRKGATPTEAAVAAYSDLSVPAGAPVGVFFELFSTRLEASAALQASFTLSVTPIRVSLARRIAASLRLSDRPEAVRMRWQGVLGSARESEVIALVIPPSARGRYRLQLSVTPRGSAGMTASRDLEIVR